LLLMAEQSDVFAAEAVIITETAEVRESMERFEVMRLKFVFSQAFERAHAIHQLFLLRSMSQLLTVVLACLESLS